MSSYLTGDVQTERMCLHCITVSDLICVAAVDLMNEVIYINAERMQLNETERMKQY